jgi:hypothetical protein
MAMSPLHPNHMTPDERLAELGEILARGLIRLHAREASPLSADDRDSFVDLPPHRSRHANAPKQKKA